MAEPLFSLDMDTEPSPVLGKADALIARHRGTGVDPNVPVLTDLDPAETAGGIPVLTQVASVLDDELMFTPDEIRAEPPSALDDMVEVAKPAVAPKPAIPAASPVYAAAAPSVAPVIAPTAVPDMIEIPISKPTPKAPVASPSPDFDFPDLAIPVSPKAGIKTAPPLSPAHVVSNTPMMPDLALNFDFAVPGEEPVAAAPISPAPVVVKPAPVVLSQPEPVSPLTPTMPPVTSTATSATRLVSDAFPDLSIELDAALAEAETPQIDVAALAETLIATLRPEIEALVKQELKCQVTAFYAESVKRTLGTLQPQLDKLIHSHIEEAIKRR